MEQVDHHTFFFFEGKPSGSPSIRKHVTHTRSNFKDPSITCTIRRLRCTTLTSSRWAINSCVTRATTSSGESGGMSLARKSLITGKSNSLCSS
jgi:hypothetical protein